MRIGELAKAAEVSRDTIRHYLQLGLLQADRNPLNGYQEFAPSTLQRLRFIRVARHLGFRLDEVQHIFGEAGKGRSPCSNVRDIIQQRIAQTRESITELEALCERMESAMHAWDSMPDGNPDGHSVCRLIESQDLLASGQHRRPQRAKP